MAAELIEIAEKNIAWFDLYDESIEFWLIDNKYEKDIPEPDGAMSLVTSTILILFSFVLTCFCVS